MEHLCLETTVAAPRERVFDLSRSVDAHTDSMTAHGERAIDGVTEGLLEAGDRVTWKARHFGVPMTMGVKITSMDRPHSFRDEQVSGPFAVWEHEHDFESVDRGTRVTHEASFAAPLGPVGSIAETLVLRRHVRRLLRARLDHLAAVAESDRWEQFLPSSPPKE